MNEILRGNLSYDYDALPDYQVIIREFQSGLVEIVQRLTKPMDELRTSRSFGVRGLPVPKTEQEIEASKEENLRRAERRARQQVSFRIRSIGADHLLTLVYRENMQDSDRLNADFTRFVRLVRERYPDWQYVAVKEYQERGALHMHVACVGKQDLPHIRSCWYLAIGGSADDRGEETKGQVDLQYRKKRFSGLSPIYRAQELANYLTKYISKTFEQDHELGERRYKCSRGIPKPKVTRFYYGAFSPVEGSSFGAAATMTCQIAKERGVMDLQLWNIGTELLIIRGVV
ncbi:MAG: hypothetical protein WC696_02000 [Candidatus Methylopumilus sp.]|jgi:hypothetical protein